MFARKHGWISGVFFSIAMTVGVLTLVGFLGRYWWPLEISAQFRYAYSLLLVPLAAGFFIAGRTMAGSIITTFAIINLLMIVPLYFGPVSAAERRNQTWRAAQINVLKSNKTPERVLEFIDEYRPDFIVLEEVDKAWLSQFALLDTEYPHVKIEPRADSFGIALLSRRPINRAKFISFGPAAGPSVVAEIKLGRRRITVIGVHPPPPKSSRLAKRRNEQLKALASYAASHRGPLMVLGDFNSTSWSPFFRDFISSSGLRDSRRGFGLQPTWPAFARFPIVAIDHCLISKEVVVHDRRVGPRVGSDHLPVLIDFSLARRP